MRVTLDNILYLFKIYFKTTYLSDLKNHTQGWTGHEVYSDTQVIKVGLQRIVKKHVSCSYQHKRK